MRTLLLALFSVTLAHTAFAQDSFQNWNLEPGIKQAHLVMVARVQRISRITVVEGAKTDIVMREYRFQPMRVLKGIFQRDELSMTAADLGLPPEDTFSDPPLKEGEFRLLILAQQSGQPFGSFGCVSPAPGATTFEQRVPLLKNADDPLVSVAETLIAVTDERSRSKRAKLLVDRLLEVEGEAAIPLLTSLNQRADWAVIDDRAYEPLAKLIRNPDSVIRGEALGVLQSMLTTRRFNNDRNVLDDVSSALRELLQSDEAKTQVRVAALHCLGYLLPIMQNFEWESGYLISQSNKAATFEERAAAVTALSRMNRKRASGEMLAAVTKLAYNLPLDETPTRQEAYATAAVRLLPAQHIPPQGDLVTAEQVLQARLKRSIAAQQSLTAEVNALGEMRSEGSLPLLLEAANQTSTTAADRYRIAWALGELGDDKAVPVLVRWMRSNDFRLKEAALSALESIDSQTAAQEVRPLLKLEAHLPYKLRIARLLARHGFADGYALATEHLADDDQTAAATLVLVALDDARTTDDLSEILSAHPDRRWYAATLTGLAAIGDSEALQQLRDILPDDRHPMIVDAAKAAGLTADSELLLPLAELVQSRNKQIALSSLISLRRFLSGVRTSPQGLAAVNISDKVPTAEEPFPTAADIPEETRNAIAEAVASLVTDSYVDADVRQEAFAVARILGGNSYRQLLDDLADQAELEGTPLLKQVQAERRHAEEIRLAMRLMWGC